MAGQYALPQRTPMAAGTPPVSPSSRAAHAILDTSVKAFAAKHFPQYAHMIPEKYANMSVREAYKGANFLEKQMFASKLAGALPPGVTMADVEKAVSEPAPPPEKPAAAPAPPPAVAPAPAPPAVRPPAPAPAPASAPAVAPAPAPAPAASSAPPAAAGGQYTLPQAPPATRGPTTGAAAALPTGGSGALDYLAKYGGHASVMRDGKIVSVHPGTAGSYAAANPEFAARLAAAGQAYEKATGKTPQYGEMSRGEDVQSVYYNRYKTGQGGIAAAPGHSQHQKGGAADLPDSDFRRWLYAGNAKQFGLHFPVKGDAPHVQADPSFKGQLATGALAKVAGSASQDPRSAAAGEARAAAWTATANAAPGSPAAAAGPNTVRSTSAIPAGTSPETTAAINQLAARLGVSPAAIAGVIKTESNWNPQAGSPGGTYKGLTQIGQTTFNEAGGKLGGMTYDEYLKASPDKQVAAYGDWLNHYQFSDKAQRAGVDLAKLSPAQQAAYLQGFQFAPNDRTWQIAYGKGEGSGRTTPSEQAGALGDTSMNAMTKYYENLLKGSEGPNSSDIGQAVGGGGMPSMPDPAPFTPSGGGGVGSDTVAAPSGGDVASPAAAGGGLGSGFGGGLGDALSGLGGAMGGGGGSGSKGGASGPTTVPMAHLPTPPGPQPMVDVRMAEMQRNQLAAAMARLNSGKLF